MSEVKTQEQIMQETAERRNSLDDAFKTLKKELVGESNKAVEKFASVLQGIGEITLVFAQRDQIMQELIQTVVAAQGQMDAWNDLSRALIIELQEKDLLSTREAILDPANRNVVLLKDTVVLPRRDSEGNLPPAAHFDGELVWALKDGMKITFERLTPDTLLGTSFAKLPVFEMSSEVAMLAFSDESEEKGGTIRFVNDRIGKAFNGRTKITDKILHYDDIRKEIKFETVHETKMNKITELVDRVRESRGYELLGMTINETFRNVITPTQKYGEDNKLSLMTEVTAILWKAGEILPDGSILPGAIIQEEWVLFESEKSKTKIDVKQVVSNNIYSGTEDHIKGVVHMLKELLAEDRKIFIDRVNNAELEIN